MTSSAEATKLDSCGCCEVEEVDRSHVNSPGQAQLDYRIGEQPSFLRRMLALLPTQKLDDDDDASRPLRSLTARSTDDPAVALLDAWAITADVITFYQERIANEGFLRTAVERRSVLDLARSIGYELNPGVAASVYLAFTVDDADGAPKTATIDQGAQIQSIPAAQGERPQTFETTDEFEARVEWNAIRPRQTEPQPIERGVDELYLEGVTTRLEPGDPILLVGDTRLGYPGSERWDFRILQAVEPLVDENVTHVTWETGLGHEKPTVDPADNPRVFAFRNRAAQFGHNAPDWRAMPESTKKAYDPNGRQLTRWPEFENPNARDGRIDLNAVYPKIVVDNWVVLRKPIYVELYRVKEATVDSRTDFTLTAQVTHLHFDTNEHLSWFPLRETVAYIESEELSLAERPLTTPVEGDTIEFDGVVDGLQEGQPVIVSGPLATEDDDAEASEDVVSELTFIKSISPSDDGNRTKIILKPSLENSYDRSKVKICGNVVAATHGETVADEVLGRGDGAQTHQRFTLNNKPLTFVSASTPSGSKTTLTVRVNNILWDEQPSLFGLEADRESYILRIADDTSATAIFGDGKSGARLPTGQENVRVTYRFGIGAAGAVGAGALTLLKTRPFGIREVTNPLPASGAEDPELLDNARANAPLTVLTLDRIVSRRDFEDFATAFAGIGKAQALVLWDGATRLVHVTIADTNGQTIAETSDLYRDLRDAIDTQREGSAEVRLADFIPLSFNLSAKVKIDSRFIAEDVLVEIASKLVEAFSFEKRTFGQPVTAAEVIEVIHSVEGVIFTDLDELYITEAGGAVAATLLSILPARPARSTETAIERAELLLINSDGITLTVVES